MRYLQGAVESHELEPEGARLAEPRGSAPRAAPQPTAVSALQGTVEVKPAAQGTWTALREKGSLHPGDWVRTGPTGTAMMRYFDGSETRLLPNTTFEVLEASLNTPPAAASSAGRTAPQLSRTLALKLVMGDVVHKIGKLLSPQDDVLLSTPNAVAGVHGTVVEQHSDGLNSHTRVVEGRATLVAVTMGSDGQPKLELLDLPAGHAASALALPPGVQARVDRLSENLSRLAAEAARLARALQARG